MSKRRLIGAAVAALSSAALGALMFLPRFSSGGLVIGSLLMLVLAASVLDLLGAFQTIAAPSRALPSRPLQAEVPVWLRWAGGFDIPCLWIGLSLLAAAACRFAVQGTLAAKAPWSGPVLAVLGVLAIALAWLRRKRFDGRLHEGLLVFALASATIMSTLGSQGLWDCWETHYGEVARRQLEQDDWIGLYWEDEWFFSKPILTFWMMNFGMALFGVSVGPDQIPDHVEWGLRFLVGVLSIAMLCGVYLLLARRVSKRAGLFAAVVLGTMPMFGFMARQAITDMPFVGFMTLAVVFFLLGITAANGEEVKPWHWPVGKGRVLPVSGFHAVIAGYVLVAVPQLLYIATRSSEFVSGTLGRENVALQSAAYRLFGLNLSQLTDSLFGLRLGGTTDLALDWLLLGLGFAVPFLLLLFTLRKERRRSRLAFHGMYLMLALSAMAKGLAGIAMPLLGLVAMWLLAAPLQLWRRPREFFTWHKEKAATLDLVRGIALFLLTAAPWYTAMYVRHGVEFINRFFIHDHLKRLSIGVHGDTGTFGYYAQQLSYAAFPWTALLPFAVLIWPLYRGKQSATLPGGPVPLQEHTIRLFTTCWFISTFALLTLMVTKFHHYTFPLVPPAAILVALFLEDIWQGRVPRQGAIAIAGALLVVAIGADLCGQPDKKTGILQGYAQLAGLFVYKYDRPLPTGAAYDYSLPILLFTLAFVAAVLSFAVARVRAFALALLVASALLFDHFVTQHYMVDLAPHWTQKHLIRDYYDKRRSSAERLVAFQMNWKGENFYTGNRVLVYVSTKNKEFEAWIDQHRGQRHFFITEAGRFERMSQRTKAASGKLAPLADTCNKYKIGIAEKL